MGFDGVWCLVLATVVAVSSAKSSVEDLKGEIGHLKVAQCRAQCLDKFAWKSWKTNNGACQQDADCFMCWESCELLNQNYLIWGSMCIHADICFPGCQQACSFYSDTNGNGEHQSATIGRLWMWVGTPQILGIMEEDILKLTWSVPQPSEVGPNSDHSKVVYVVFKRTQHETHWSQWSEIEQTADVESKLDLSSVFGRPTDFRIIAVSGSGVIGQQSTSYHPNSLLHNDATPIPNNASKGETATVLPSIVKEVKAEVFTVSDVHKPDSTAEIKSRKSWPMWLASLYKNTKLGSVDAIVYWPAVSGATQYLVTWEVKEKSFGVTGHLYTDSTTVKLNLWPDSIYEVQVQVVSDDGENADRSLPLTIDTNNVVAFAFDEHNANSRIDAEANTDSNCTRIEVIAGAVLSVAIFILLMVICYCIKRVMANRMIYGDIESTPKRQLTRSNAVRRKSYPYEEDFEQNYDVVASSYPDQNEHPITVFEHNDKPVEVALISPSAYCNRAFTLPTGDNNNPKSPDMVSIKDYLFFDMMDENIARQLSPNPITPRTPYSSVSPYATGAPYSPRTPQPPHSAGIVVLDPSQLKARTERLLSTHSFRNC